MENKPPPQITEAEAKSMHDALLALLNDFAPLTNAALRSQIAELQAELSSITANYETAQANWDLCLDTIDGLRSQAAELRAENERLRKRLESIASCVSHHPDDVVAIARRALGEQP